MSKEPTGRDLPDFRVIGAVARAMKSMPKWERWTSVGQYDEYDERLVERWVEDVLVTAEHYIHEDCIDRDFHKECEQTAVDDESALRSQIHELEKEKKVMQGEMDQLRLSLQEMRWI